MTRRPGQGEAWTAWGLWGLTVGVVFETYARLEPAELYHVSREGLAGGLSRGLVLLNFPVALVSIALVLVAMAALPRRAWWVAATAIALSAAVAWPGVVDQDDLDARWINAIPALGVLLALVLTAWAAQRAGSSFAPWGPGDRARLVVAVLVIALSLPGWRPSSGFTYPETCFSARSRTAKRTEPCSRRFTSAITTEPTARCFC
ncbi:MAG: hypothetical protein H0U82_05885 [Actinobacteria bacterium]|nr:hypothetical protein [Actinomycetota bacterium]